MICCMIMYHLGIELRGRGVHFGKGHSNEKMRIQISTSNSLGDTLTRCQISMIKENKQNRTPVSEIHFTLLVCLFNLKFAKFTIANIIKNPALPIREILERSNRLAKKSVISDVRINPSSGRFQIFFSKTSGSSPSLAMM